MFEDTDVLQDWLGTLPLFKGEQPGVVQISRTENWTLYLVESGGDKSILKHFSDAGGQGQRAKSSAEAEAEGLRIFGPRGLAPELLWKADLPGGMGYVVIYNWVEGYTAAKRRLLDWEIELYAEALWAVHSEQAEVKMLAPYPRNLEAWWAEAHGAYREMPHDLLERLPHTVSNVIGKLVQSIAGDVQFHKRYWQDAPLTPVHGGPLTINLILKKDKAIFVDWHRFGLGDPAYEVARISCMGEQYAGEDRTKYMLSRYLVKVGDQMPGRRIEIYRRVWPFSRVLFLLARSWDIAGGPWKAGTPAATLAYWASAIRYHLGATMKTYGWSQPSIEATIRDVQAWMADLISRAGDH